MEEVIFAETDLSYGHALTIEASDENSNKSYSYQPLLKLIPKFTPTPTKPVKTPTKPAKTLLNPYQPVLNPRKLKLICLWRPWGFVAFLRAHTRSVFLRRDLFVVWLSAGRIRAAGSVLAAYEGQRPLDRRRAVGLFIPANSRQHH